MGIEGVFAGRPKDPEPASEAQLEDEIEHLLAKFGPELEPVWKKKIDTLRTPAERHMALKNGLRQRELALAEKPYMTDRLRILEVIPRELLERMDEVDSHATELDRGYNGRILKCNYAKEGNSGADPVVYKVLLQPPILPNQNSLRSEAAYQADMFHFARANKSLRVHVPRVHFFVSHGPVDAMAQEEITNGVSVKNILEQRVPIPKGFDVAKVFAALSEFVTRMNGAGFYHRDLREGNIMLNLEATTDGTEPLAYIIDMGFMTKAPSNETAYRNFTGPQDHVIIKQVQGMVERYKAIRESEEV